MKLHKTMILQFLNRLGVIGRHDKNITLLGHNWGFLLGATLLKGIESYKMIWL